MRSWARSFELNKKREARFFNTIHVATIRIPHPFVLICSNEIHWSETPAVRNYLFHCVGRYWCSYVVGRGTYEANVAINLSICILLATGCITNDSFSFNPVTFLIHTLSTFLKTQFFTVGNSHPFCTLLYYILHPLHIFENQ